MRFEVRGDAVGAGQRDGDEIDRLLQAVVGFGATEAEEAGTGFAEAFAAEAGDAEVVVGSFEQVQREAVALDA